MTIDMTKNETFFNAHLFVKSPLLACGFGILRLEKNTCLLNFTLERLVDNKLMRNLYYVITFHNIFFYNNLILLVKLNFEFDICLKYYKKGCLS